MITRACSPIVKAGSSCKVPFAHLAWPAPWRLGLRKLSILFRTECKPGDVIIVNDPWLLAGHLNDVCVLSPGILQGTNSCFYVMRFSPLRHWRAVASDNREVYEEGLFIPPLKLYEAGVLNEGVLNLIRWNVSTPEQVIGDIRSQVASNHVCAEKVVEMLTDEGLDDLEDLAEEIICRTETSMRTSHRKIPNGQYCYKGLIEGAGKREDIKHQSCSKCQRYRYFCRF